MEPLTQAEHDKWFEISAHDLSTTALVRSSFRGQDVALISHIYHIEGDDQITIEPVAILITDEIMAQLTDPSDGL